MLAVVQFRRELNKLGTKAEWLLVSKRNLYTDDCLYFVAGTANPFFPQQTTLKVFSI